MSYILGIDIGGTFLKGEVLKDGSPVSGSETPTDLSDLAGCVEAFAEKLAMGCGARFSEISGVGIGCPGVIDDGTGTVVRAANLGLENYPLRAELEKRLGLPVKIGNDANCAALGEAAFGAGKDVKNSILVTLGTGVGGGIVIDGKLFTGNRGAGAEIGHMVIEKDGEKCTCGRRGCLEAYCSASALTRATREAMENDTSSAIWRTYTHSDCDGRTAFEYMDSDPSAKRVVDTYINRLACGLVNLANIFRPQVILIGGGVSAQGTRLTAPLQRIVDGEMFAAEYAPVEIRCASLGNRAGALGAAALFL